MSFLLPLNVMLGASTRLTLMLTLGHAVALAGLVSALPGLWGLTALPLVAFALCTSLGRHALRRSPRAAKMITLAADDHVMITCINGSSFRGEVLPGSFVHPALTVLNVRALGRRLSYHVIIMPDAVEAQAFRQLRVWLRWGYRFPEKGPDPEIERSG